MTDDPVDLTALAPDQLRVERATRAILAGAHDELQRRQRVACAAPTPPTPPTPLGLVANWRRPLIAASAVIALPGVIALGAEPRAVPSTDPALELATALGVPSDFLAQLMEGSHQ